MRTLIKEIGSCEGKQIIVKGWIHRIRDLGKVCFIILRDRSGAVQLVLDGKPGITLESVVTVTGLVQKNEKALSGFEIAVQNLEILGRAEPDLPISVNQDLTSLGIDSILDNRILTLRNPKILSIFKVQAEILRAFAEYLRQNDFTEIKSSKLIGTGTEGGTGLFQVDYFDTKVYLAQSPQFYKQAMVASGLERVFEIGQAYRAEKHETPRHLNEYVSLDVEMAFIESEVDLMDFEQGLLKYILRAIDANCEATLAEYGVKIPKEDALDAIPRITHDEAKKIISDRLGRRVFEINPEGERVLCKWALEEAGIEAVFVRAFPRKKRPFYTYPDGTKTMSFDLLFKGLEITTGGRRIHEYTMLKETLPRFKLTEEDLGDYVKIFKYGCPPHGGFAIGLERLTQRVLNLDNVKEATLFPRDRKRVTP